VDAFPISTDLLGKSASAYEHIRRAVRQGRLRPGRRLSPTNLATSFRISETPIREALVRLAAEGFLHWEASRGYFIKPITLEEQADLHDVLFLHLRGCLESGVQQPALTALARLARAEAESAAQVEQQLAQVALDLAKARGNGVIAQLVPLWLDRTSLVRSLDLGSPSTLQLARKELAIFGLALSRGDLDEAVMVLAAHMTMRRRRLPELVALAETFTLTASYP
jgi:DNA-binding GntR family transcriptional regulator